MYSAIATNKRNTVFIMLGFVILIAVIGWIVGYLYNDISIFYVIGVVTLIYVLIQYFAAGALATAVAGAKQIQKKDNPRLWRVVENLSITLGLPMPKVYIIDDPAPNAFATGRDPKHAVVAATSGILEIMDDRELTAVMAHEMGHVQNYDIRVSTIAFGMVSAIALISDLVMRMLWFGGNRRENNSNPIILIIGIVVIVLAPIMAVLIQMAISRQREYLADASSAMTTRDPEALADALQKLEKFGRPMKSQSTATAHLYISDPLKPGIVAGLFSTHPPLKDRIKRLRGNIGKF